jgi:hypothetical protein
MRTSILRPSTPETSPLSGILSMLASSVHSAVDIGSSSCLYKLDLSDFDRPRFIDHNYTQRMHALTNGLAAALKERGVDESATADLHEAIESLLGSLMHLENFEKLSDGALADIAFALTSAFHDCRSAIRNLAADLEVRVAFFEELSAQHEEEYDMALAELLPQLRKARDTGRLP